MGLGATDRFVTHHHDQREHQDSPQGPRGGEEAGVVVDEWTTRIGSPRCFAAAPARVRAMTSAALPGPNVTTRSYPFLSASSIPTFRVTLNSVLVPSTTMGRSGRSRPRSCPPMRPYPPGENRHRLLDREAAPSGKTPPARKSAVSARNSEWASHWMRCLHRSRT